MKQTVSTHRQAEKGNLQTVNVRFGSKADMCSVKNMSALPPIADIGQVYSIISSALVGSAGGTVVPPHLNRGRGLNLNHEIRTVKSRHFD